VSGRSENKKILRRGRVELIVKNSKLIVHEASLASVCEKRREDWE
jgi:hypothetical protein